MQDPQDHASASASQETAKVTSGSDAGWERQTLERLAFANLDEQKTARRWKVGLRLVGAFLGDLLAAVQLQVDHHQPELAAHGHGLYRG
jgi:protease-4